jgi:hypothetical protein
MSDAQALDSRQRLQVFRRTVRQQGYSPLQAALLLSLLAMGALAYDGARWLKAWDPRRDRSAPRLDSRAG